MTKKAPHVGQEWGRNVPAKHFHSVVVREVRDGWVEYAPTSCWYDPNTTFVSKVPSFIRNYSLAP